MITKKENNIIYVKMDYYKMPTNTRYLMSKKRDEYIIKNSNNEKGLYRVSCYLSVSDFVKEYEIELPITTNNKLKNKNKLIKIYGEKNIDNVVEALDKL